MDLWLAIQTCLIKKYATFNGRACRAEYWLFLLFNLIGSAVLNFFSSILATLFSLLLLIPVLAAAVRRLHDINKSGWYVLLGFIPLVNLYLLYLLIKSGDPLANRFGPPTPLPPPPQEQ